MTSPLKCGIINTEKNKKGKFEMKIYETKRDLGNNCSATYRVKAENKEQAIEMLRKITGELILKVKEL